MTFDLVPFSGQTLHSSTTSVLTLKRVLHQLALCLYNIVGLTLDLKSVFIPHICFLTLVPTLPTMQLN